MPARNSRVWCCCAPAIDCRSCRWKRRTGSSSSRSSDSRERRCTPFVSRRAWLALSHFTVRSLVISIRVYILGPRTNPSILESQHGEGKEEGQEESCQEEIGLNSAVAKVAAESYSKTEPAAAAGTVASGGRYGGGG